jgi:hypothetical protein
MNLQNLKADVNFLCGSTSATYPDADKVRNMNVAYQDVARLIWESDGAWSFDDNNNTDYPIAYRTIANASGTYLIPTNAQRIESVEIKDANGQWLRLKPLDYVDLPVAPSEYLTGTGTPIYYHLEGTQIELKPTPGTGYVTMTSGMAVRLNREVTELAVTATTTTPGFATAFHRILSLAASIDFIQDNQQRQFLAAQKARLEQGLVRFYSKRGDEMRSRVVPAIKKRWKMYV